MLEHTDDTVGLEGGEFLLGVLVEISEKLTQVVNLLEFDTSNVSPISTSSSTPHAVGI